MQVCIGFYMHGDHSGPGFDKLLCIFPRLRNHQVRIYWKRGRAGERLNHRQTDSNVRDEMAIHYIHVKYGCATALNRCDLLI